MPQKEGGSYITEFTLISKAQKGDIDALGKLIDKYYDNIFSYLFRKVGNVELAEDLTQEVFLRLVNALSRYRPTGKFSNYVLLDNTWLGVYFGSVLLMLLAIGIMVIQFKHMEERCYGA